MDTFKDLNYLELEDINGGLLGGAIIGAVGGVITGGANGAIGGWIGVGAHLGMASPI